MMRKIFCLLTLSSAIFGQINSVHQRESEYYSSNKVSIAKFNQAIELNKLYGVSKVNKTVFGYLPWWEYAAGSYTNLRYDLLSHLAIFSWEADVNGTIKEPVEFAKVYNAIKAAAQSNNVKLIFTVTCFNSDVIHTLLSDISKRQLLIDNIMKVILQYGFGGVNIDFENLKDADKQTLIGDFAAALKNNLSRVNTVLELSFALPITNFGNWNFDYIAKSCDYIFIMAYDFFGSWSDMTGPSAPLAGTYYNLTNVLLKEYATLLANNPDKLILGVPYYGNYWKTKTKEPYTKVDTTAAKKEWVSTLKYREIIPAYVLKEKVWDNISSTPWLRWYDTSWNQIWYDDSTSLGLKFDLALQKNLKGIGIWALGYDNGRQELWNLIEKKFATTSIQADEQPTSFQLYQNYPNPFNPETVISYQIPQASNVSLKVYDILGRELATLVDEYESAGVYNIKFSISSNGGQILNLKLSSGLYIYKLQAGSFFSARKMMITK